MHRAVEAAIQKILTPATSLDLINAVRKKKQTTGRPYTISFVGVNGVGKSTSLSKLAFFLLNNDFRVMIAACDSFRSGAVEQLRVHVRNLRSLAGGKWGEEGVALFERGYGKEASGIAREAIAEAARGGYDVVLIDTAGRRHNDKTLMGSLERFVQTVELDKIFQVAEALVGTDSIMQARNFSAALGRSRNLDGFIISKVDTVGELVGTIVSMVYVSGMPVVFVGTGQMYTDLRTLSAAWTTKMLMS